MDINQKFQNMIEQKKREQEKAERALVKRKQTARLIESFMNIHQLSKTGLCNEFVESFYEKKSQELGETQVDVLKKKAAEYIHLLKYNGEIYEHISWFKFVLEREN